VAFCLLRRFGRSSWPGSSRGSSQAAQSPVLSAVLHEALGCIWRGAPRRISLVFLKVDAEALGHAVEGSAVDAENLCGLATMMFGDFEDVKKVAAF